MEPDKKELASLFPNVALQMRGALSNLYLAASQLVSPEARESDPALDAKAAVLDQSYYRLLRLVNSLSAAEYLVEDEPFSLRDGNLSELVGRVCEQASDLAEMLGLHLSFVCASDRFVCAMHAPSMEQMLYHLLSNAFKFTPAGGSITVELQKNGDRFLLTVSDTGCGIPPERMETLFDRYLHSSIPEPPAFGLGLGLPLCRRIAQLHDGTIVATSSETGSRFTVYLPERQLGGQISDSIFDYTGGFNRSLLGLADALPAKAFLIRNQK